MSMFDDIIFAEESSAKQEHPPMLVVRVRTEYWYSNNSLCMKKSIKRLSRKSTGFDFLAEEVSNVGAEDAYNIITNLEECKDGIYEVSFIATGKDWETGIVDDWEYKLVPYKEPT